MCDMHCGVWCCVAPTRSIINKLAKHLLLPVSRAARLISQQLMFPLRFYCFIVCNNCFLLTIFKQFLYFHVFVIMLSSTILLLLSSPATAAAAAVATTALSGVPFPGPIVAIHSLVPVHIVAPHETQTSCRAVGDVVSLLLP